MGLLRKIFRPDHPDVAAARKDAQDFAARAPQRIAADQALQTMWNQLALEVQSYGEPDWLDVYRQRPVDNTTEFDWALGNCIQDLGHFQPLKLRVPAEISQGMIPNVKRSVVRDYWAAVTHDAVVELQELIEKRQRVASARSPEGYRYVNDYHWYADRFCLYQLPCMIADTQVNQATWNEGAEAVSHWSDLSRRAYSNRAPDLKNLQGVLEALATDQPEDFEALGYSADILEFLGVSHLCS